MSDDARAQIATELGVSSAPWTAQLSAPNAEKLLGVIRAARQHQATTLEKAIDEALTHVPRLLRGALKRVLFS